jgi:hypothetical protein
VDAEYQPVAFQLTSDDDTMTDVISLLADHQDVTLSPVRRAPSDTDLNFDLSTAQHVLSAVTAVITTVRAGKQVIDLILTRIRTGGKPIVIKIGKDRLEISKDADPELVRSVNWTRHFSECG